MDALLGPWMTVVSAYLDRTPEGPLTLVYELDASRIGEPMNDFTRARDRRGRSVFEAFTSIRARYRGDRLPLRAFLEIKDPDLTDVPEHQPFVTDDQRDALAVDLGELLDFVYVFGPVGVMWPTTLEALGISNLRDESDQRGALEQWIADTIPTGEVDAQSIERLLAKNEPSWVGRVGSSTGQPSVEVSRGASTGERYIWPSMNPFRSDSIEAIAVAQERALEAASLVNQLVRLGPLDRGRPDVMHDLLDLASEGSGPYEQVRFVDRGKGIGLERRGESLLAYIYEDLLEHVDRKPRLTGGFPGPHFPVPTCEVCGGSVLARRRPGERLDKTHGRCRNTAKSRRRAQKHRDLLDKTKEEQS